MKSFKFLSIYLSVIAMLMVSCQSKEEKAAEFIKSELSKTLYDFDSYQPVETIVTEAKNTIYNDSTCWNKGILLNYAIKKANEYMEESNEAKERMEIWGAPTYYSTSYSDSQYYKYKNEYNDKRADFLNAMDILRKIAADTKKIISKLDTSKVIGWEVKHRFRCKTKGGNSTLADYRYVLDKDFQKVILCEDLDDDSDVREAIELLLKGSFDDL